jgi:cardiolipin synthase A/B
VTSREQCPAGPSRRVLVAALALLAAACSHTTGGRPEVAALVRSSAAVLPRAYVYTNRIRLVVDVDGHEKVLNAHWKRHGLDEGGFRFRTAELQWELGPAPPLARKVPEREVDVRGVAAWERLADQVVDAVTPRAPGEGVWLQMRGLERVLLRDPAGHAQALEPAAVPPGTTMTGRVNLVSFVGEATALLAGSARDVQASRKRVLFVVPGGPRQAGYLLFDLDRSLCVFLALPESRWVASEGTAWGGRWRMFDSLVLKSHLVALVKNPVSAVGRLLNLPLQFVANLATSHVAAADGPPPPLVSGLAMDLRRWESELDRVTGTTRVRGSLRLLLDGETYFPVLLQRIAEARETIHIRVNIFDRDDVAVEVAEALKRRSAAVKVRVLFDAFSSLTAGSLPPATAVPEGFVMPASIKSFLEKGSRVEVRESLNPWLTADHAKVFTFDRRYAHLGGMNIGREYRYEWHDLMFELEGPVVGQLEQDFVRSWAHEGPLGDLAYLAAVPRGERFAGPAERADFVDLRVLSTGTGVLQVRTAVLGAIGSARGRVFIENPYLYDNAVVNELVKARRRGVDVRVVLPSDSDLGLGNQSNMVTANTLLANGVRVFVYPGMTHVKALLVDGWSCLGSANFNKLSLRRNLETNVASSDPGLAARLERELFERDFAVSTELEEGVEVASGDRLAELVMNQF